MVGARLGDKLGPIVGVTLGDTLGAMDGVALGYPVGATVGEFVGLKVGAMVGFLVGDAVILPDNSKFVLDQYLHSTTYKIQQLQCRRHH